MIRLITIDEGVPLSLAEKLSLAKENHRIIMRNCSKKRFSVSMCFCEKKEQQVIAFPDYFDCSVRKDYLNPMFFCACGKNYLIPDIHNYLEFLTDENEL